MLLFINSEELLAFFKFDCLFLDLAILHAEFHTEVLELSLLLIELLIEGRCEQIFGFLLKGLSVTVLYALSFHSLVGTLVIVRS